jgi:predicted nucleic acid-binding protein
MILVIDANVLFAALIKNSLTAELIFSEDLSLYACEFIIDEFLKYEEIILKKTHRKREQFITIMHQLKEIITIVPQEEYSRFMAEAEKISPDKKDVLYFALALKLKSAIWSNDKKLKEQNKVKVYSTDEVMKQVHYST